MNINCIICSDLFVPTSEVYVTRCGHVFHYTCLLQWVERSPTCPQCRSRTTERSMYRIYFNIANTDNITDDIGTLQDKVDNLQYQVTVKDKDVESYRTKYKRIKSESSKLRDDMSMLEDRWRSTNSTVYALKDQLSYFKSKAKENHNLNDEILGLRNKLRLYETVQLVHESSKEDVQEMLANERNTEGLALMIVSLKRTLVDEKRKGRDIDVRLTQLQNDNVKCKKEVANATSEITRLRQQLEYYKSSIEDERADLISDINNLGRFTKRKRKDHDSSKPLSIQHKHNYRNDVSQSPNVSDLVKDIKASSSPYLSLKCNSVPTALLVDNSSVRSSSSTHCANPSKKYSIFKTTTTSKSHSVFETDSESGISYDGFGGHSKEDTFSIQSKCTGIGRKRPKTNSAVPASKYRRLAPNHKYK